MVSMSQPLGLLLVVLMQLSDFAKGQSHENSISALMTNIDTTIGTDATSSADNSEPINPKFEADRPIDTDHSTESDLANGRTEPRNDPQGNYRNDEASPHLCPDTQHFPNRTCSGSNSDTCPPLSSTKLLWNIKCVGGCLQHTECCQPSGNISIQNDRCVRTNDLGVPMVGSCSPDYRKAEIKKYCESFQPDLRHDLWIMAPVTDTVTGKTYKNVFCAVCNQLPPSNVSFWRLPLSCFHMKNGSSLPFDKRHDDIISRLYPRKIGIWKYKINRKEPDYAYCFLNLDVKAESKNFIDLKCCACDTRLLSIPEKLDSKNDFLKRQCSSASARTSRSLQEPTTHELSITLKSPEKERSPRFQGCTDHFRQQNSDLYDILCMENDKLKCKQKLVDCAIEPSTDGNLPFAGQERYFMNTEHCFCCGPQVNDSFNDTWLYKVLFVLLGLLRAAVAGLLIHEVIFFWLPAKSTWDKNLGGLGLTLLVQDICAVHDRDNSIISCRIFASIWHYCMLSSFTWMLIFSYDCWLSLRQLFQVYQLVGEYDQMQFLIYFAISQIIPIIVTGAALAFGSSSADLYCQQDLGLDRYECLLAEVPGFTPYFLITASTLFLLNIYFLIRIGCLVFPKQLYLKEARQTFRKRTGYAIMMSPTWMLGSLILLAHFELPAGDILIVFVHVLQTFLFLIYAFIQWLDRIMQKFEEIERDIFGEPVYDCPMTSSVLITEDRQLLEILEGRRSEKRAT